MKYYLKEEKNYLEKALDGMILKEEV